MVWWPDDRDFNDEEEAKIKDLTSQFYVNNEDEEKRWSYDFWRIPDWNCMKGDMFLDFTVTSDQENIKCNGFYRIVSQEFIELSPGYFIRPYRIESDCNGFYPSDF